MLLDKELTERIIGAAIEVHRHLGAGCLEVTYRRCMGYELGLRGVKFREEVRLPMQYKGLSLAEAYRLDMLIEERVIVEIKAVETILPVHEAQLLTYMRLSGKRVGLLINFNVPVLKDGIIRKIL